MLERPDGRAWAAWAIPSALALATHYFAGFLVVAEAAWLIARCPRDRRMALATGGVAAVAVALLPLALAQRSTGNTAYIGEGSVATRLVQVPKQLLGGYASPGQALTTALLALLVVAAAARLAAARDDAGRARVLVVAAVGVAAILLPVLLVVPGLDYLNTRNVLAALPVLLIALAGALALPAGRLPGAPLAAGACAVLAVVTLLATGRDEYGRDDWRGVEGALGPQRAPARSWSAPAPGGSRSGCTRTGCGRYPPPARPCRRSTSWPSRAGAPAAGREAAPVPRRRPRCPPGFRPAGVRLGDTFTVARYAAPRPTVVRPADLAAGALWPGDAVVLLDAR